MKTVHPNYAMTIVSVALVLLLVGIYSFIYMHPELIVDRLKEELQIVVEMKDGVEQASGQEVMNQLGEMEAVRKQTIEYISASQAAREMQFELGPLAEELNVEEPFRDMVTFSVHAKYFDPLTLEQISGELRNIELVQDVYYQEDASRDLELAVKKWSRYAFYLGIGFGIIAIILIYNTLKLALFSKKKTILTLDMVGARKSFIKRPILRKSIFHGLVSSLIAVTLIVGAIYFLGRQYEAVGDLLMSERFMIWLGGMLLLGISLQWLSTHFILRSFLSGRIQEA